MKEPEQNQDKIRLQLKRPFGQTIALTIFIFLLLVGAAELIARTESFQSFLADPTMGSRHYQLGRKLARLNAVINNEGPVDCLIIGSSMVDVGFNPEIFQEGFK